MKVTVVLDNIRSGLNVGSVFRSADSFGAERILLCGITAVPPSRDVLKSALGATGSVKWDYFNKTAEALTELRSAGYKILAVEQSDVSVRLDKLIVTGVEKTALVFGNEVRGVDESLIPLLDGCIEIPQTGIKHSLNVSVCAGIVLWKYFELLKNKA